MIAYFLDSLDWGYKLLVFSGSSALFIALGLFVTHKTIGRRNLKTHQEITFIVFSNVGVLYAVLLGFSIINSQQRFDLTEESTQIEAACLSKLYRDSHVFPLENQQEIQKALMNYIHSVIEEEWGQTEAQASTSEKLHALWASYMDLEPPTPRQQIFYTQSITELNKLVELRFSRLLKTKASLGKEMWSILILGGACMIFFLCFFAPRKPALHIFMSSVFAIVIAFSLCLIYSLDGAFSGKTSISSKEFQKLLIVLQKT